MTFAKGAALKDPAGLFNSSLEGNTRRAIDFHEGEKVDEGGVEDSRSRRRDPERVRSPRLSRALPSEADPQPVNEVGHRPHGGAERREARLVLVSSRSSLGDSDRPDDVPKRKVAWLDEHAQDGCHLFARQPFVPPLAPKPLPGHGVAAPSVQVVSSRGSAPNTRNM